MQECPEPGSGDWTNCEREWRTTAPGPVRWSSGGADAVCACESHYMEDGRDGTITKGLGRLH